MSMDTNGRPTHWLAKTAFASSLVAVVLAFYGSFHAEKHLAGSMLQKARGTAGLPAQPKYWWERLMVTGETTLFGDRFDRVMLDLTSRSKLANVTVQVVAFFAPFALGLFAAFAGGSALTEIERRRDEFSGNFQAVFAIMIGGLATVTAGCMILSQYIWPSLPSLYT